MQRWRGLEDIPEGWGRSVVTIGSYDGVHRGHQLIIGQAVARARELGIPAVVVTFDPHPSEVVRPGTHPPLLAPHHRRAELMAELGVDAVLILPFTKEFSKLAPGRLRGEGPGRQAARAGRRRGPQLPLRAQGHRQRRDARRARHHLRLHRRGHRPLRARGGGRRRAVLLHAHPPPGRRRRRGRARWRSWAGRTASRASSYGVRSAAANWASRRPTWRPCRTPPSPPTASTRACCTSRARRCRRPSRSAPTRSSTARARTVEAYAIDRVGLDLYGLHVGVDFLAYIRGQEKFDTLDALLERMAIDVKQARGLIAAASS